MECPECGSQYPVEKIGFDENASKDKRGFQISNPNLFPYYSKSRYYFLSYTMISWSYVISSWLLLGFVVMFFVANFYVGLIFSSSSLLFSYLGYDYYTKANDKIDDLEKKYISRLLDNYYCGVDEIVFDKSGDILDHREDISQIKNALNEHDMNGGFANIRYMMASGLVFSICLLSMPFLNFPDSKQNNGNSTAKSEKLTNTEKNVGYGVELPDKIDEVNKRHINGAYKSRHDIASDYWIVYDPKIATWENLREMEINPPNWAYKQKDEYQGIIYWHEKGHSYKVQSRMYDELTEEKYMWGVWKMGGKFTDEEEGNSGIEIKTLWNRELSKGFSGDDPVETLWVYEYPNSGAVALAWDSGLNASTFSSKKMKRQFWANKISK